MNTAPPNATDMRSVNTVPQDREDPRYIADELLLTFVSLSPRPPDSAAPLLRLLHEAQEIAGIGPFTLIEPQRRQPDGAESFVEALEEKIEHLEKDLAVEGEPWGCLLEEAERALELLERFVGRRDEDGAVPAPTLQRPLTLRIGLQRLVPPSMRDPRVTVGVNRINSQIGELRDGGLAISAAMPNWILSSSAGHVHDGPGTVPSPVPPADDGKWEFGVPEALAWARGTKPPAGQDVIVAVLDTWPGRRALQQAAETYGANWLMGEMQQLVAAGKLHLWQPPVLGPTVPQRATNADADHGLFVAGIVHSVAAHAEIHLLRVLDGNGLGSTDVVLAALQRCLDLTRTGRRVVVNLSLYLLIPPDDAPEDLWDYWFAADPSAPQRPPQQNAALLEFLDERVEDMVSRLLDAGAVIIAAAGNDALDYGSPDEPDHLQPRLPADYDTVCCVVAAGAQGEIAAYSNRADLPLGGNGIATWGGQGEVVVEGTTTRVVVPGTDGVVGVYSGPDVTAPGDNKTGWAYWSGTSFATPIVSGLAANVLARDELARQANPATPRLSARGVWNAILAEAAATSDPRLGCPYVPVRQYRA